MVGLIAAVQLGRFYADTNTKILKGKNSALFTLPVKANKTGSGYYVRYCIH